MIKYAICLLGIVTTAFAGNHNVILEFSATTNLTTELSQYSIVSYKQLGNKNMYKVVINSPLSRTDLIDELRNIPTLTNGEENQDSTLLEREAASDIDGRILTILDGRIVTILDNGPDSPVDIFNQNFLDSVRAKNAWPYASGNGVIVAVLDTGVDSDHELLSGNMLPGYDFVDEDNDPREERLNLDTNGNGVTDEGWGHGTHIAGILKTVAPNVSILPVRVADSDGVSDLFNIIQGLEYAKNHGARVINLSMSIYESSPALVEMLNEVKAAGILVVTSAGNNNSSQLAYPAQESEVLTVASVDSNGYKSPYSNYATQVDVSAPGDGIISCLPGGGGVSRSGTSMATPVVAAQAAIILELVPDASIQYIRHRIINKSKDIGYLNPSYNNMLGGGMADVWDSITLQNQ